MVESRAVRPEEVRIFTVCDSGFFLGLVGLINSLRLSGNPYPLTVLDAGLTAEQRSLLEGHCTIAPVPDRPVANPTYYKVFALDSSRAAVRLFVDSDIIVTGSLAPVVELARQGKILAYVDPDPVRWFPEWREAYGLRRPLRRQPYINAGFLVFDAVRWEWLLRRWREICEPVMHLPGVYEGVRNSPTSQMEQDALNALLMSEVDDGVVQTLSPEEAPMQQDVIRNEVRVVDPVRLIAYRGTTPVRILHWTWRPKPWDLSGRITNQDHAYARLLARLCLSEDVAIRVPTAHVPYWMRFDLASQVRTRVRRWAGLGVRGTERFVRGLLRR